MRVGLCFDEVSFLFGIISFDLLSEIIVLVHAKPEEAQRQKNLLSARSGFTFPDNPKMHLDGRRDTEYKHEEDAPKQNRCHRMWAIAGDGK